MTDAQRIDGDDYTYWWQLLGEAGNFTVEPLTHDDLAKTVSSATWGTGATIGEVSGSDVSLTLYGTMHNGDVSGLSLVDVPPTYNTQTHAQRTDNALWHLSVRIAELNTEVQELRRQLADMTADS